MFAPCKPFGIEIGPYGVAKAKLGILIYLWWCDSKYDYCHFVRCTVTSQVTKCMNLLLQKN